MKNATIATTGLLILILIGGLPQTGWCMQQTGRTSDTEAARVLGEIRTQIEANNWPEVAASMTPDAWDAFCAQIVVECISIASIEIEIPIPGIEDAQDAILEALEKHGLDKIEIKQPSIEIRMDDPNNPDDKDQAVARAEKESQKQDILKRLNQSSDRMAIVADLWKAKSNSPFTASVFMGKIEEETRDGETFIVKVTPAMPKPASDEGISIMIAIPPVFVNISKVGDDWKFAGVNQKKTDQAMKDFKPPVPGGTDF
jgi:hypothetical protein